MEQLSRRQLFGLATGVAGIALLGSVNDGEASKGWCRSDPVVRIDSDYYAITGSAESELQSVTYVIRTPPGADVELIMETPGVAVEEETVFQTGAAGSVIKFSMIAVPKSGQTPAIQLITAKRFEGAKVKDGVAPGTLYTTY